MYDIHDAHVALALCYGTTSTSAMSIRSRLPLCSYYAAIVVERLHMVTTDIMYAPCLPTALLRVCIGAWRRVHEGIRRHIRRREMAYRLPLCNGYDDA